VLRLGIYADTAYASRLGNTRIAIVPQEGRAA
jgi:hypothetical protein